ncbi:MAG: hypothetical protein KDE59_28695 [Anaerolineales bacterium]|nr:hypothetical protein [Anaerolineales bacterium]
MQKRILVIDNHAKDRESLGRWLTQLGYSPTLCGSIPEARELLARDYYHAVTIDMRMRDDSSPDDYSGFEIIQDPAYEHLPKIISTSYRESAFKDEWGSEITNRADIYYMGKLDPQENRRRTLQNVFRQIRDDFALRIHFSSRDVVSFRHLAAFQFNQRQADQIEVLATMLEALLRRLFRGHLQVTIDRLFCLDSETVTLSVYTYSDGPIITPVPNIVVIGRADVVRADVRGFPGELLQGAQQNTFLGLPSELEVIGELAAVSYRFSTHDPENVRTLSRFIQQHRRADVETVLTALCTDKLSRLHSRSFAQRDSQAVVDFYEARLAQLTDSDLEAVFQARVAALCDKLTVTGLARLAVDGDTLVRVDETGRSERLPHALRLWPASLPNGLARWNLAHGQLNLHTIIVTNELHPHLTRYSDGSPAPQAHDYASLELSLRSRWPAFPDSPHHLSVELWLAQTGNEEADLELPAQLPGPLADSLRILASLRRLAAAQGCDPGQYELCLRSLAIEPLLRIQPEVFLKKRELQYYLQLLMLISTLSARPEKSTIEIKPEELSVRLAGQWHHLSPTDFSFFEYLWVNRNQVCPFEDIAEYIAQAQGSAPETVNEFQVETIRSNMHTIVNRVRRRFGFDSEAPIANIRGIGYKYIE